MRHWSIVISHKFLLEQNFCALWGRILSFVFNLFIHPTYLGSNYSKLFSFVHIVERRMVTTVFSGYRFTNFLQLTILIRWW